MDTTQTTTTKTTHRSKLAVAILLACTVAAVGGNNTYGSSAQSWPTASSMPRAESKPTLLVFVYPGDARSEAKLAELATVIASARIQPFVAVVHVADTQPTALWETSGKLLQSARLLDKGGVEARRFGATTTGHVVVYDANGTLQYTGTPAQVRTVLDR